MKTPLFSNLFVLIFVFKAMTAHAATEDVSLEEELGRLNMPANVAPLGVSSEQLYSIQSRYAPLRYRSEVSLGGSRNFNADSFIASNEIDLNYRFHLGDRWSIAAGAAFGSNSLTAAGKRLLTVDGIAPDTAPVKSRSELTAGFNAFYGKFRVSMEKVLYFDQYFSLGASRTVMDSGAVSFGPTAEAGFVFWMGKRGSVRLSIKDHYYKQKRRLGSGMINDVMGGLTVGYLFGG